MNEQIEAVDGFSTLTPLFASLKAALYEWCMCEYVVCVCVSAGCLCVHFRFGACHGDVVTSVRGVHFAVASVVLCSLKCKNKYHMHTHTHVAAFTALFRSTFSCFWAQVYITLRLLTAASLQIDVAVCVRVCVCVGMADAQLSTADWILLCCDFATLWRLLAHFARPLTSQHSTPWPHHFRPTESIQACTLLAANI